MENNNLNTLLLLTPRSKSEEITNEDLSWRISGSVKDQIEKNVLAYNKKKRVDVFATPKSSIEGERISDLSRKFSDDDCTDYQCLVNERLDKAFLEDYDILYIMNRGYSGFVVKARPKCPGKISNTGGVIPAEDVAVKIAYKMKVPLQSWTRDKKLGIIPSELLILSRLNHSQIVKLLGFYEDAVFFYYIFEYIGCSGIEGRKAPTDLFEFVTANEFLSETEVKLIFRQIVSAVHYLHGMSIVHGDIKNENIAIDCENNTVKLVDFGCSGRFHKSQVKKFDFFLGTLDYAAPETLSDFPYIYGPHIDIWAMGIVLFTLIFRVYPFDTEEDRLNGTWKTKAKSTKRQISAGLEDLISSMLQVDYSLRPTIDSIICNNWLNSNN